MNNRIIYTDHGEKKRRDEGLSTDEVQAVLRRGLVLRRYPEDRPFPSRLVLGWIDGPARLGTYEKGRPIHVVASDDPERGVTWIVTIYEPDPDDAEPVRRDRSIQMEEAMDKHREHLEGLNDLEGAPCLNCPEGEYEAGTVTRTLEDGPTVLVVKEVPALVCDKCGDAAFSEKVSERLEELVTEAAAAGVQFEVRHWRAPSRAKAA